MPPETPHQDPTHLTLAMNTQLKIFYRPKSVTMTPEEAMRKISWHLGNDGSSSYIELNNPTPLNISFTSISIGATKVQQESDMMIKPFSQRRYWLASNNVSGVVAATYLDDNGSQIKQQLAQ